MDIKRKITNILMEINEIPQKDFNDIIEFLDHDEWGIAFEVLCSVVEQEKLLINVIQYNEIVDIGCEMEMDSLLWEKIYPRVNK